MKLGLIGLGKMGMNLALNMQDNGHTPVGMDLNPTNLSTASAHGLATATDLTNLLDQLPTPRIVWIMVPAGKATNSVIEQLAQTLSAGDIVLDGGNSHYQDSIRHGELLASHHINFLDVGTSGGQAGARHDGNFMIGGDPATFQVVEPLFKAIAAPDGYLYTGPHGSRPSCAVNDASWYRPRPDGNCHRLWECRRFSRERRWFLDVPGILRPDRQANAAYMDDVRNDHRCLRSRRRVGAQRHLPLSPLNWLNANYNPHRTSPWSFRRDLLITVN